MDGTRGAGRLLCSNPEMTWDALNGFECGVNSCGSLVSARETKTGYEILRCFATFGRRGVQVLDLCLASELVVVLWGVFGLLASIDQFVNTSFWTSPHDGQSSVA